MSEALRPENYILGLQHKRRIECLRRFPSIPFLQNKAGLGGELGQMIQKNPLLLELVEIDQQKDLILLQKLGIKKETKKWQLQIPQ